MDFYALMLAHHPISVLLQEAGQIGISELAIQYAMHTELLASMLQSRIGTIIKVYSSLSLKRLIFCTLGGVCFFAASADVCSRK